TVAADGTTGGGAVLMASQHALGAAELVGKEVGGFQGVVTVQPEGRAVELVATALGHDVDLGPGDAPEFGRSDGSGHAELLHGVGDAEAVQRSVHLGIDIT